MSPRDSSLNRNSINLLLTRLRTYRRTQRPAAAGHYGRVCVCVSWNMCVCVLEHVRISGPHVNCEPVWISHCLNSYVLRLRVRQSQLWTGAGLYSFLLFYINLPTTNKCLLLHLSELIMISRDSFQRCPFIGPPRVQSADWLCLQMRPL